MARSSGVSVNFFARLLRTVFRLLGPRPESACQKAVPAQGGWGRQVSRLPLRRNSR